MGGRTARCTSRVRKSRASTGSRSRAAPTSARASSRSSHDCSPTSLTTEAGTAGRRMEQRCRRSIRRSAFSRACWNGSAPAGSSTRSHGGASPRRGVPARTRTVPPPVDGSDRRPAIHDVLVPDPLVLRRAACARLLPDDGREAGRSDRGCGRPRRRQARGGWPLAAREHAPGADAFRDGGRGLPQPLEHAAGAASAPVGGLGRESDPDTGVRGARACGDRVRGRLQCSPHERWSWISARCRHRQLADVVLGAHARTSQVVDASRDECPLVCTTETALRAPPTQPRRPSSKRSSARPARPMASDASRGDGALRTWSTCASRRAGSRRRASRWGRAPGRGRPTARTRSGRPGSPARSGACRRGRRSSRRRATSRPRPSARTGRRGAGSRDCSGRRRGRRGLRSRRR